MAVWLVTGGSGFLGRHVLDALRRRAADVRIVALGRQLPSGWPDRRFVRADLNDLPGLTQAVARLAPDIVIHTAGLTPPA